MCVPYWVSVPILLCISGLPFSGFLFLSRSLSPSLCTCAPVSDLSLWVCFLLLSLCPLLFLGPCPPSPSLSHPVCPFFLWVSVVWVSVLPLLASPDAGSLLHLYHPGPPDPALSSWPPGLLKEKERKAALPAATVPGPGLETAGPAEAPAAAAGGGGSPRGRPAAAPGPSLLAPLLWERTLPFGDVEYVDLDAFLLEHGLPPSPPPHGGPSPAPSPGRTPAPSPGPGSCGSASPRSSPGHAPARAALGHRAGAAAGQGLRRQDLAAVGGLCGSGAGRRTGPRSGTLGP